MVPECMLGRVEHKSEGRRVVDKRLADHMRMEEAEADTEADHIDHIGCKGEQKPGEAEHNLR